jgi:mannosyltransferase OCH1-like enzyme
MYQATQTWLVNNPEYKYKLYNAEERLQFLIDNFDNSVLKAYCDIVPGAFKADLFRLCLLYVYGGYYVDCDMVSKTSLDMFSQIYVDFITVRDDPMAKKWLANGFIASTPKHPFLKEAIKRAVSNIQSKQEMFYLDYTGPGLLGKSVNAVLQRDIETDYELGVNCINGYSFLVLLHDFAGRTFRMDDTPLLMVEYPTYREEMKEIGNKPFFDYVQNKRIYKKVPNTIIYTSLDETDINDYMVDSFKKHNPEYELLYFPQTRVDQWFKNSIYNDAYQKLTQRGEKADFFRYCYLWEHGGVYTDTDTFCNQPIRNWLTYQDMVVGLECDNDAPFPLFDGIGINVNGKVKSVANWTIAVAPKHPVLSWVINDIINNPIDGVLQNTGPGRFTKHVLRYFGDQTQVGDSLLLPINGFGSNQSHSNAYKTSKPLEVTRKDVFITHMFAGTWRGNTQYKPITLLQREKHPAVSHNLTLFETEDGYKGISRYDENQERTKFMKEIGEVKTVKEYTFTKDLKVIDSEVLPITGYSSLAKFEDYRHFTYKGKDYYCTAYIDDEFNTNMCILDEYYNFLGDVIIDNYNKTSFGIGPEVYFEKNWLFFEKDDELYFIYSTTPDFVVYKCVDFDNLVFEKHITQNTDHLHSIPKDEMYWTKVTTGGSTNPIELHGDLVYLIHTKLYSQRKYNHWAVTVDKNLRVKGISSVPFISKNVGHALFFITTMIDRGEYVLLTGGVEDNQNFLWEVPKSKLLTIIRQ